MTATLKTIRSGLAQLDRFLGHQFTETIYGEDIAIALCWFAGCLTILGFMVQP